MLSPIPQCEFGRHAKEQDIKVSAALIREERMQRLNLLLDWYGGLCAPIDFGILLKICRTDLLFRLLLPFLHKIVHNGLKQVICIQ
jgi:hypothetical protein